MPRSEPYDTPIIGNTFDPSPESQFRLFRLPSVLVVWLKPRWRILRNQGYYAEFTFFYCSLRQHIRLFPIPQYEVYCILFAQAFCQWCCADISVYMKKGLPIVYLTSVWRPAFVTPTARGFSFFERYHTSLSKHNWGALASTFGIPSGLGILFLPSFFADRN